VRAAVAGGGQCVDPGIFVPLPARYHTTVSVICPNFDNTGRNVHKPVTVQFGNLAVYIDTAHRIVYMAFYYLQLLFNNIADKFSTLLRGCEL
jgi:hypothetical protein